MKNKERTGTESPFLGGGRNHRRFGHGVLLELFSDQKDSHLGGGKFRKQGEREYGKTFGKWIPLPPIHNQASPFTNRIPPFQKITYPSKREGVWAGDQVEHRSEKRSDRQEESKSGNISWWEKGDDELHVKRFLNA